MDNSIRIRGAREHNLKNISLEIPRDKIVVFTGLSGSGKSTLVMDTIFAEGQRRYLESLSSYARQFLGQMQKPDVEEISGLSPTIAISQKSSSHNPRSTVGTVTEIQDYLRLLYARIGIAHCLTCGQEIRSRTVDEIVELIVDLANEGDELAILAPMVRDRKGEYSQLLQDMFSQGFVKARINGREQRLDTPVTLARYRKHSIDIEIDRLRLVSDDLSRLTEAVELASNLTEGFLRISLPAKKIEQLYNLKSVCPLDGTSFPELEPRLFSFNSPHGACPTCDGLGVEKVIDEKLIMPDLAKTIANGGLLPGLYRRNNYHGWYLRQVMKHYRIPDNVRLSDIRQSDRQLLMDGPPGGSEVIQVTWRSKSGRSQRFRLRFGGIRSYLKERYQKTESEAVRAEIEEFMSELPCPECQGARLNAVARAVTVSNKNLAELSALAVKDSVTFIEGLTLDARERLIAERLLAEITNRLRFLNDVGLEYLSLDRSATTLAGGETQRIRLASQVGSGLVGVLYILDEPTIGLHPRDNTRLVATLKRLRDLGNSILVIEHDLETIEASDWLVDIGPGAGRLGGEVIVSAPLSEAKQSNTSVTAKYLRGELVVPIPKTRRKLGKHLITVVKARAHNLKNLTISFPLGTLTCVTGVSGSGKSTLVNDVLYQGIAAKLVRAHERPGAHDRIDGLEAIDKVIDIDQSPIGRTPRSNPATYTGVFTSIRELYAQTEEAKVRGYGPGRFSFNVAGGRCEACHGDGYTKIEMQFLPDVYLPCDVCKGRRYNRETLSVMYKHKTIADVLEMTVDEAVGFFENLGKISDKLRVIRDVGLGYIHLGQSATTLSGGEAQRMKLAAELAKRATGRTLYILDEPTTGLHFDDVKKLLEVLHRLVEQGNTVIVIEHNLDVVKTADWVIDLGPEGGADGGELIVEGTPEDVARHGRSYTGQYLKRVLASV